MSETSEAKNDWDQAYLDRETPWDSGQVESLLIGAVESSSLPPGHLLEIGCGTGTNARFLSSQGFQVTALDFSPTAIEKALDQGPSSIDYRIHDILQDPLPAGPYDSVFDRGVFHLFSSPDEQRAIVEKIAAVLRPGGCWLSILGSTEGPPRDQGPPRRTARDVMAVVEPHLEIVSWRAAQFSDVPGGPKAWEALFRRREQPAQPPTE